MKQDIKTNEIMWSTREISDIIYPEVIFTVKTGAYLYGFAIEDNVLLQIDLSNGKVDSLGGLSGEDEDRYLVSDIYAYKGNLILSPNVSRKIYIYDLKKNKFRVIDEKNTEIKDKHNGEIVIYKNKIYCLPKLKRNIICLDIEEMTAKTIGIIDENHSLDAREGGDAIWLNGFYSKEDVCFSVVRGTNYFMEYSLPDFQGVSHQLNEKLCGLIGFEDDLYILTEEKRIIRWNITEKKIIKTWEVEIEEKESVLRLRGCVVTGDVLYFLGWDIARVKVKRDFGIKIDTKRGQVFVVSFEEEFKIKAEENEQYSFSSLDTEGNIYFISSHQNLQIYNVHTKDVRKIALKYTEAVKRKNIKKRNEKKDSIGEKCWSALKR